MPSVATAREAERRFRSWFGRLSKDTLNININAVTVDEATVDVTDFSNRSGFAWERVQFDRKLYDEIIVPGPGSRDTEALRLFLVLHELEDLFLDVPGQSPKADPLMWERAVPLYLLPGLLSNWFWWWPRHKTIVGVTFSAPAGPSGITLHVKPEFDAAELASVIFDEWVLGSDHPLEFDSDGEILAKLDDDKRANYFEVVHLYKTAIILGCFMTAKEERRAKVRTRLLDLQSSFERLVVPPKPDYEWLHKINAAKRDIAVLMDALTHQTRTELSWALEWLHSVGVEETNPVTAMAVATYWMNFSLSSMKAILESCGLLSVLT